MPSAHTVPSVSSTHARITAMLRPMRTASAWEVRWPPCAGARNRTSQLTVRQMLPRVQAAVPATWSIMVQYTPPWTMPMGFRCRSSSCNSPLAQPSPSSARRMPPVTA